MRRAFLAPAALVAAVSILPLAYLAGRVAADPDALALLARPSTPRLVGATALLAAVVTAASTVLALPLAWLTARTDLPARRVWTVVLALPLAIPSYVGALAWIAAAGTDGLVAAAAGVVLPPVSGLAGATLVLALLSYPYVFLAGRAGFAGADPALEEASRILGRGPWATFARVTLPAAAPALAAGALMVALYVASDFGAVSLLRYESLTYAILLHYQASFDRAAAAAYALILAIGTVAIVSWEARARARTQRVGAGVPRPARAVALGPWKGPAILLCASVAFVALVFPLGVLGAFLAQGLSSGEPIRQVWAPAARALGVSAAAAGLCLAGALPVAVVATRRPGRLARIVEAGCHVGFGLPGIVVAVALVGLAVRHAPWMYQTIPLLLVAYVVLFLPLALGSARAALASVRPSLEEAARSLGAGPFEALRTVTLPLIAPGLAAGAALVLLVTIKELPATLLLAPTGFETLATRIWSAASDGFLARAAAPAVALVALAAPATAAFLAAGRMTAGPR